MPVAEATPERLDGIAQILAGSPLDVSLLICFGEGFAIQVDTTDRRALKRAHAKKGLEIGARVGGVIDVLPEYQAQARAIDQRLTTAHQRRGGEDVAQERGC